MFATFTRRTLSNMPQPHFLLSFFFQFEYSEGVGIDRIHSNGKPHMNSMWCWARTRTPDTQVPCQVIEKFIDLENAAHFPHPLRLIKCEAAVISFLWITSFRCPASTGRRWVRCQWRCNRTPLIFLSLTLNLWRRQIYQKMFHEFPLPHYSNGLVVNRCGVTNMKKWRI